MALSGQAQGLLDVFVKKNGEAALEAAFNQYESRLDYYSKKRDQDKKLRKILDSAKGGDPKAREICASLGIKV